MSHMTKKKEALLSFLRQREDRAVALQEIIAVFAPDGKGESTVYRLLSELVEAGLLRKLSDGVSRHFTYRYIGQADCVSHLHMTCTVCGRLYHMDRRLSHEIRVGLQAEAGFLLSDRQTMLYGTCVGCAGKGGDL